VIIQDALRGGTQRLAVLIVVVCVAATACGRPAGNGAREAGVKPTGESLAVRVGSDARALALVQANAQPIASVTRVSKVPSGPPPLQFRRRVDAKAPLRLSFIGDSVAYSLIRTVQETLVDLVRDQKIPVVTTSGFEGPGFGLTADVQGHNDVGPTAPPSAYRNWMDSVRKIVAGDDPDVTLVLLGIWDTIERDPGGRVMRPGTPEWRFWYGLLAAQFVRTLTSRGGAVVWLVMPCVGRPELNPRLALVNAALHDTWRVAPGRVGFVDLSRVACRNGAPIYQIPSQLGPVQVRMLDGIHFSPPEAPSLLTPFLSQQLGALLTGVVAAPGRAARA
jgi:hypothetical protein